MARELLGHSLPCVATREERAKALQASDKRGSRSRSVDRRATAFISCGSLGESDVLYFKNASQEYEDWRAIAIENRERRSDKFPDGVSHNFVDRP
jgi:hypothetical protein